MNILFLIKKEPDETLKKIIDEQGKTVSLTVVDLREDKDYDQIVERIISSEKVISW